MKKLLFLFSVIALAACGDSDDGVNTPPDVPSPRLLTVVVGENPMQDESAPSREMTRAGDATTTASLTAFSMNYENNKYDFTKKSGTWSTIYWLDGLASDTQIDFYAYNGGTFNWNSGNPYIAFTTDSEVAFMKDFLVAKHEKISYDVALAEGKKWTGEDKVAVVSQTFDHACAAVQFKIYKEESTAYSVSSIVLKDVRTQGDYYFNNTGSTPKWQNVGTTKDYELHTSSIAVTNAHQLLPCGWLYLIPQSKSGITIDVTYSKAGAASTTKTLNLSSGTWEAGMQYTVNIKIGK